MKTLGVRSLASLVVLLCISSCGFGEAHFQAGWARPIKQASRSVEEYRLEFGRLPDEIDDAFAAYPSAEDAMQLVQYRKEGQGGYELWIRRGDIGRFIENPQSFIRTEGEPQKGDVWGKYDAEGELRDASWHSIWS